MGDLRKTRDRRSSWRLMVRNPEDEAMRCAGSMAVDGPSGIRGQRTIPSGDDTEEACVAPDGQ
jgi:hypothetical protein